MTRALGTVISADKASLAELETILGTEDLYMLLEIVVVDNANQRLANKVNRTD